MTKKSVFGACLVVLLLAGNAHAALITYTSSVAFLAAVGGGVVTETFEGLALNSTITSGSTVNGLTYSFPAGKSGRIDNLYGRIGSLVSDTTFTSATFTGLTTIPSGFNLDNLSYALVPEPASGVLLITGLAGLAARHWRSRRAARR